MAATIEGRRLTEAHRLAQTRVAAQTVQQLNSAFPLLDVENIDGTIDRWLRVAVRLVQQQRTVSARLAGNYLTTFRTLELGISAPAFLPLIADTVAVEAVITSLTVTGPAALKSGMARGESLASATDIAQSRSAAAGMRHALNGGRDTIVESTRSDTRAVGWARATSGKTCAFCAMLASRGAVYSESGVDFEAHDHCSCSAEPIYRDDAALPAGSERFRRLWQEAKDEGGDPTLTFRRLVAAE